jgi:prephenate dehydrogenase
MEPKGIGIIGGLGSMGRTVGRFFTEAGYQVEVADAANGPISWKSIAENDVIVLAVPIPEVEGVVRELGPFTRENGLVMDIASIKDAPVRSMLQHCRGEVIGTHPLFGPSTTSLKEQTVFVWPARSNQWINWLNAFLVNQGVQVVEMEPNKHDRLMGTAQVLRHMLLLCLGRSLMLLDFDLAADLKHSGPWFGQLIDMLSHQMDQSPELYADIATNNPATMEVSDHFLHAVEEITASYLSKNRTNMIRIMDEVSEYLSHSLPTNQEIEATVEPPVRPTGNVQGLSDVLSYRQHYGQ